MPIFLQELTGTARDFAGQGSYFPGERMTGWNRISRREARWSREQETQRAISSRHVPKFPGPSRRVFPSAEKYPPRPDKFLRIHFTSHPDEFWHFSSHSHRF